MVCSFMEITIGPKRVNPTNTIKAPIAEFNSYYSQSYNMQLSLAS